MAEKKSFPSAVGVSGNRGLYGSADTGEYLAALNGYISRATFDKMRRQDAQIKSTHLGITLPIRQAEYYFESPTDKTEDRVIVEQLLRMRDNMSITWDDIIRHICLQFIYGFMVMAKEYKYDEKLKLIVPTKIDPRMPTSIDEWKYDEGKGRLIGPVQIDENGKETILPIERLLIFTTDKEGDNWEGISLLRAMFGPWKIKQQLIKIDAIKHDRHGTGIPVMMVPSGIATDSDEWKNAEITVAKVHACEKAGLVLPYGWDFKIVTVENNGGTDVIPSVEYQDAQISRAGFSMFTNLAQSKGGQGSFALSKSFVDLYLMSVQTYTDYICEVLTRFWVREIANYNWVLKDYPMLKARRIKELDNRTITELAKAGLILHDLEVENALRDSLSLPEKKEDTTDPEKTKKEPGEKKPKEKPDDEKKDPDSADEDEMSVFARTDRSKSALQNVELNEIERIPNLFAIEQTLDSNTDSLEKELFELRDLQVEDLIIQVLGGKKIQNLRVILKKEMYQAAIKKYKAMIKEGKQEVIDELITQGAKIDKELQIDYEDLAGLVDDELAILIEKGGDVLKTHLMVHAINERKRGVVNNDELRKSLKEEVGSISLSHWKSIAAVAINGGWGDGRRLMSEELKDEIEYAYYSPLLDGSICPACEQTYSLPDSQKHEVSDPRFTVPNPKCYSTRSTGQGNFCRCFEIYIAKEESQEPAIAAQRSK